MLLKQNINEIKICLDKMNSILEEYDNSLDMEYLDYLRFYKLMSIKSDFVNSKLKEFKSMLTNKFNDYMEEK